VNEVQVRAGVASDAETIADFNIKMAMETEHLRLDPPTVNAGVRAGLADAAKARYFVAEIDGRVVGQLMLTHEWSDWRNGDIWWIESVYVHPDHRGRGVFGTLYRYVAELARTEAVVALRLYVEKENANAKKTYEKLGMKMTCYDVMEQMFG
jgi:GNAT superfamily N-acetyltransferase